jgi:hypothetical protein
MRLSCWLALFWTAAPLLTVHPQEVGIQWNYPERVRTYLQLNTLHTLSAWLHSDAAPIQFRLLDGPATLDGNELTITNVGPVRLEASVTPAGGGQALVEVRTFNGPQPGFSVTDWIPMSDGTLNPQWIDPEQGMMLLPGALGLTLVDFQGPTMRNAGRAETPYPVVLGLWQGHAYLRGAQPGTMDIYALDRVAGPVLKGNFRFVTDALDMSQTHHDWVGPYSVVIADGLLVVVLAGRIASYSLADPVAPKLLADPEVLGFQGGGTLAFQDGFLLVKDYFAETKIFDLRDPRQPKWISRFKSEYGDWHRIFLWNGFWVMGNGARTALWDISNLDRPVPTQLDVSFANFHTVPVEAGGKIFVGGYEYSDPRKGGTNPPYLRADRVLHFSEHTFIAGTNVFALAADRLYRGTIQEKLRQEVWLDVQEDGAVSVRSSSGLPVTLRVPAGVPAYLDGNWLILTNELSGMMTPLLIAEQMGNETFLYESASFVTSSLRNSRSFQAFHAMPETIAMGWKYTLPESTTAGLPVRYTLLSGPATFSAPAQLEGTGAGEITLRAEQAGNEHLPAIDRTYRITVVKRHQELTVTPVLIQTLITNLNVRSSSGLPVEYSIELAAAGPWAGDAELGPNGLLRVKKPGGVWVRATQPGNDTFAAADTRLYLQILPAPEIPLAWERKGSLPANGTPVWTVLNNHLYLFYPGVSESRFEVWNISDLQNPVKLRSALHGDIRAHAIAAVPGAVLVSTPFEIDILSTETGELLGEWCPASPLVLQEWSESGLVRSVRVRDRIAFVAASKFGFKVLDLLDPAKPRLAQEIPATFAKDLVLSGDYVYLSGLWRDASGAIMPGIKILRKEPDGEYREAGPALPFRNEPVLQVGGDLLFAFEEYVMRIFSIAEHPAAPELLAKWAVPNGISEIQRFGNLLLTRANYQAQVAYDISNPRNPLKIGLETTYGDSYTRWQTDPAGEYILGPSGGGLQIYERPRGLEPLPAEARVATGWSLAARPYVNHTDSIQTVEISGGNDPSEPALFLLQARKNSSGSAESFYAAVFSPASSPAGAPYFAIQRQIAGETEILARTNFVAGTLDGAARYRIVFKTRAHWLEAELERQAVAGWERVAALIAADGQLSFGGPGAAVSGAAQAWIENHRVFATDGPPRLELRNGGELAVGLAGTVRLWRSHDPEGPWQLASFPPFTTNRTALNRSTTVPLISPRAFYKVTN